jgi:hypothetical protein
MRDYDGAGQDDEYHHDTDNTGLKPFQESEIDTRQ